MTFFAEAHDRNIASHARAPQILRLLEMWESRSADDSVPHLSDLMSEGLGALSEHYALLMPDRSGDFVYVHFGSKLADAFGMRAGRTTMDLPPMLRRQLLVHYQGAYRSGRARFIVTASQTGGSLQTWERLAIPLRTDGDTRLLLVLGQPRELSETISEAIIQASPDGILALQAVEDDLGTVFDARIVATNPSACRITRRRSETLIDGHLLQIFPGMARDGTWDQCLVVFLSRDAVRFDINHGPTGESGEFRFTLFPMYGGLAMMFQDITDLSGDAIPLIGRRVSNLRQYSSAV